MGGIYDADALVKIHQAGSNLRAAFDAEMKAGRANICMDTRDEIKDCYPEIWAQIKDAGIRIVREDDETETLWAVYMEQLNPISATDSGLVQSKLSVIATAVRHKLSIYSSDTAQISISLHSICTELSIDCMEPHEI